MAPDCKSLKETLYLSNDQVEQIKTLSSVDVESKLGMRVKLECQNSKSSIYVDSHIVRTMNETVFVMVEAGKIKEMKIVSFLEPSEYKPTPSWLAQLKQAKLDEKLNLKNGIDAISGATMSATAIVNSARKILAMDKVLNTKQ